MKKVIIIVITSVLLILSSFSVFADVSEDRQEIKDTRKEILERLYKEQPSTKKEIANATGYATFSNVGGNLIFLSAGGGYGVVHDNSTGKDTYMSMRKEGIGLSVKDDSTVFVFHSAKTMKLFINEGWDFPAQADAVTAVEDVDIYQLTERGLARQVTLQGTTYWNNYDLN